MSKENDLSQIKKIINEIEEKSADGDYIFRGERQNKNRKVSSKLYRDFDDIDTQGFDIEVVQKEMLNGAKKHTGHIPHTGDIPPDFRPILARMFSVKEEDTAEVDFEILTEIQHYGGKTNLIDFTTDYLVALFFACDGHHDKDGRIILQKTDEIKGMLRYPRNPRHRVVGQKSVFVRSPKGYIEPNKENIVIIPAVLKKLILQYLRKYHGIFTETIYNDLYGFIRSQDIHASANTQIYRGLSCSNRGDKAESTEEKQKEYEEAIIHYTKAIELKPDSVEAYYRRGIVYVNLKKFDSAIDDFTKMIELDPNDVNIYLWRGWVYKHKRNFDEAVEDYNRAIQLRPNYAEAYFDRGNLYQNMCEYDKAIQDFSKAIELNPGFVGAYLNRGLVYMENGDYDRGIEDQNRALSLEPDNANVYFNLGMIYDRKDEVYPAIENYTKAIELNPNFSGAYNYRGVVYRDKMKDYDTAIQDFTKATELKPDFIDEVYNNRGIAHRKKGDYKLAIEDHSEAIRLERENSHNPGSYHYNRGVVWLILQKEEKAKEDFTIAREKQENIVSNEFRKDYESIEDFEKKHKVKLPEDIVALLTPP
ncbi:tetratricopeptide repeat protein [Candidatus Poribacteria bacterium]|nr:tetratricopeptide repeat protein [Candidatus Poribacteria bacterium]